MLAATAFAAPSHAAIDRYDEGDAVYAALQRTPATRLDVGGGRIDVAFADGAPGLDRARVLDWIRTSAQAVTTYFGRYPVDRVGLLVVSEEGDRIHTGTTFGYAGPVIRIHVGLNTDAAAFRRDWILVHEMSHLALPTTPRRNLWMEEGEAVYVEPIARVQAGLLPPSTPWMWALLGLPKGLGPPGAGGLDGTQDHDRIYWGGFTYWLLADVAIRERTHNRIGVQAALRAINAQSGGNAAQWSVERIAAVGDAATGGSELTDLYARVRGAAYPVDVRALLARLGVGGTPDAPVFDDAAPLAAVRRAITAPPPGSR